MRFRRRHNVPATPSVIIELDEPAREVADLIRQHLRERATLPIHEHPDDEPEAVHDECPDCCSLDLRRMCADCLHYLAV